MSDYKVGDTIYHHFSTRAFATGIPTTLIGTPVAEAYEEASATGLTAGVSLTIDHAETGHHLLTIVATGANSFETGKSYGVSLTAGTVGGVSIVGEVIFNFTLEKSPAAQDLANGTDGLTALKTGIDAIPTTMRGTDDALLATNVPANFADMSITVTAGLVDITQTAADKVWGTAVRILTASTNFNDITAAAVWSVGTRVLTGGTNLNDVSVADILTTQMTESYAANGVVPTLAQALFALHQMLMDFSIAGTSITVEKLGGTTAFVVTLDDGTNPTSANRA